MPVFPSPVGGEGSVINSLGEATSTQSSSGFLDAQGGKSRTHKCT